MAKRGGVVAQSVAQACSLTWRRLRLRPVVSAQAQESSATLRAELEAQNAMRLELQERLDEMIAEAQAMRTNAVMRGPSALSSALLESAANDAGSGQRDALKGSVSYASDRTDAQVAEALSSMTIMEIKDFLTQRGHGDRVWSYAAKKPAPKKSDWVALVHEVSNV